MLQTYLDCADKLSVYEEEGAMTQAERIEHTIQESQRARASAERRVDELRRDVKASRERADEAVRTLKKAGYLP